MIEGINFDNPKDFVLWPPKDSEIRFTVMTTEHITGYNWMTEGQMADILNGQPDVVGVWERALTREEIIAAKNGEPVEGNRLEPLPTDELIRRLREKPYSRLHREAADRLEELTARSRPTPPG